MEEQQLNIQQLITNPLFKTFHSIGLIDEVALRNHFIKSEYKELRQTQSQLNSIFTLSEKYLLSFMQFIQSYSENVKTNQSKSQFLTAIKQAFKQSVNNL